MAPQENENMSTKKNEHLERLAMARYKIEMLFAKHEETRESPEANLPTEKDIKSLFDAIEDCLNAAESIPIRDKSTYFQYQDIMEIFNNRYDGLLDVYYDSFETIAMLAGETELGKRFESLGKKTREGYDRTWYKQAYYAVKEKSLTKRIKRKKWLGF